MTIELVNALTHARKHQLQAKHGLLELSDSVVKTYEVLPEEMTLGIIQDIDAMLTREKEYSTQANEIFNQTTPTIFPLKFNKMMEIIKNSSSYFKLENESAYKLFFEKLKESDIAVEDNLPKISLEGNGGFWGTSASTYMAAHYTWAKLCLEDKLNFGSNTSIAHFSLNSPLHHVVDCDISALPSESKLIYNVNGKTGYGFIHSGYSFGGGREASNKEFMPYDCSSYLKKYSLDINTSSYEKIGFSTADLAYTYSALEGYKDLPAIQTWLTSADGVLPDSFKIILSSEEVLLGDLWIKKSKCNQEKPFGVGGHMGMVAEIKGSDIPHDQIKILCVNREMPNMEGYGFQLVQNNSSSNPDGSINKVMYLRNNNSAQLYEDFSIESVILNVDQYMASHPEEYVSVMGGGEGEI